ncbi:aspartate/glutamate racemase family protein [Yangia mangrovi]|uniref:Aspartate/glutamate racemase family protein n=3 Tax=Alloyangia mangrovi TaxID=1779329 RepID=A0ABT2KID4_9RHOB|nr:aspartate/glutamate racemase family protein [Alloyangia mangrovi]MCT4370127.1 aspartate/glutamate racemase family protein [Alloyangia mangrovi]
MPAADLRRDLLRRFGLIALATDLTLEGDAARLMPAGTRLHVTRIAFENPTTPESLRRTGRHLREAAELILPGVALDGLLFGCTSASAVLGAEVAALIGARAPVTTPLSAALRACEALGVGRLSLLAPYMQETTALVADHLVQHGVEVVARKSMGYADDRDMALLTPEAVIEAALAADDPRAEALFLSCTALPAVPVIERLEKMLGKPVLSSNQVSFWSMLDMAGISGNGPGELFKVRRW